MYSGYGFHYSSAVSLSAVILRDASSLGERESDTRGSLSDNRIQLARDSALHKGLTISIGALRNDKNILVDDGVWSLIASNKTDTAGGLYPRSL